MVFGFGNSQLFPVFLSVFIPVSLWTVLSKVFSQFGNGSPYFSARFLFSGKWRFLLISPMTGENLGAKRPRDLRLTVAPLAGNSRFGLFHFFWWFGLKLNNIFDQSIIEEWRLRFNLYLESLLLFFKIL